jgi:hypothetical protein
MSYAKTSRHSMHNKLVSGKTNHWLSISYIDLIYAKIEPLFGSNKHKKIRCKIIGPFYNLVQYYYKILPKIVS